MTPKKEIFYKNVWYTMLQRLNYIIMINKYISTRMNRFTSNFESEKTTKITSENNTFLRSVYIYKNLSRPHFGRCYITKK